MGLTRRLCTEELKETDHPTFAPAVSICKTIVRQLYTDRRLRMSFLETKL